MDEFMSDLPKHDGEETFEDVLERVVLGGFICVAVIILAGLVLASKGT